jgi:hypothetical protein
MKRLLPLALGLLVVSCANSPTTAQTQAVANDLVALQADITADVAGKTLTPAQAQTLASALTLMSTDVANLNVGNTGTTASTVLADMSTVITELSPFLPEIAALATLASPEASAGITPTPKVTVPPKMLADYQKLHADAALIKSK